MASPKTFEIPIRSCTVFHPPSPITSRFTKPFTSLTSVLSTRKRLLFPGPIIRSNGGIRVLSSSLEGGDESPEDIPSQRPSFDLNLAVLLAGFAFEAYTSPPENIGWREIDAAGCQTVFLSEQFLSEVYDGRLFIKLIKGMEFPALDPWGTSDPYVIIQLDGQVAKSSVKWATKEPMWNEDLTLNIKIASEKSLQVMAWDANLVTPHKRMGNAEVKLESLCDGNLHEVVVELEGIGGGGRIYMEVKYKSYDEIAEEKKWWRIPFVSDFLMNSPLGSALKMAVGSQSVNASQFVQAAFGNFKSFDYITFQRLPSSNGNNSEMESSRESSGAVVGSDESVQQKTEPEIFMQHPEPDKENGIADFHADAGESSSLDEKLFDSEQPDQLFWFKFSDILSQSVLQKLGFSLPDIKMWDVFDLLNMTSMQSQRIAEEDYVESGLATPERKDSDDSKSDIPHTPNGPLPSLMDIKKASRDVLSQTETIFGALMVLTSTFSQQKDNSPSVVQEDSSKDDSVTEAGSFISEGSRVDVQEEEETRKLFSSAESAMEAWAMLANSLGRTSFIKSEFEKICFLDNASTDTQVAIWRDSLRRRLVVAFRGTEQAKWKDLRTDLMLLPSGLNPERLGGDFKQEVQVHSGFLNAYDSVRSRIMALVKIAIGFVVEDSLKSISQWQIYVTGHSLGGALATLLALELSSSRMAKCGAISVTMYNFGSPRVGNRRFADVYNEKVKDSWRIVNHRDIIPTVPRLMGYCHVAQPIYLAAGDLREALANMELSDGYQGDVIGEYTPDVLVNEFMKGEKQLMEKILQTEISLLRSIRDGTALMQHMEDFYYITLLESVRSNYRSIDTSESSEEGYSTTM